MHPFDWFLFFTFWQSSNICWKEIHCIHRNKLWELKISSEKYSHSNINTWTCALHWKLVFRTFIPTIIFNWSKVYETHAHHSQTNINIIYPSNIVKLWANKKSSYKFFSSSLWRSKSRIEQPQTPFFSRFLHLFRNSLTTLKIYDAWNKNCYILYTVRVCGLWTIKFSSALLRSIHAVWRWNFSSWCVAHFQCISHKGTHTNI